MRVAWEAAATFAPCGPAPGGRFRPPATRAAAARQQKDAIRLNCVNDKLLQAKQLVNLAEEALANLEEAIALENEDGRYEEYGNIKKIARQLRALASEALSCVGEDLIYVGPTRVDVEAPDVTEPEVPDDIYVEPPAYASPFG